MQHLKKTLTLKRLTNNIFSSYQSKRDIQINLVNDKLCLNMEFPNNQNKSLFLDNNFSFLSLKSLIQVENPQYKVDFDFSQSNTKKQQLGEDTLISQFIQEKNQGNVDIMIDDIKYQLKNIQSYPLNQQIESKWNQQENDQFLNIYKQCLQNKILSSHAGSISHFVKGFLEELNKVGQNKQLTEQEINNIFKQCIREFSDPVSQNIEQLTQKKNQVQSELEKLQTESSRFENLAQKRIKLYIKLILLASLIHIVSFYYMIFHVEWLGWDIIEPITYSVGVFSLLLGMRFFMKYRKNRDFQTMIDIWQLKLISSNRKVRDSYFDLNQNINRKKEQIQNLQTKIDLNYNRKNSIKFTQNDISQ